MFSIKLFKYILYYLIVGGILSSTRSTFENFDGFKGNKEKASRKLQCHPSDDFLHNLGVGMQRSESEQGRDNSLKKFAQMIQISNEQIAEH